MHPRLHANTQGSATALVFTPDAKGISYAALDAEANRYAHALRTIGARSGDTIALVCNNRPEYLFLYWAAQRTGLMLVPVPAGLLEREIAYILNDSGASFAIFSDALSDTAQKFVGIEDEVASLRQIVSLGKTDGLDDLAALAATMPDTPIADEAPGGRMIYSSGTTGRPKGIAFPPRDGPVIQPNPAALLFASRYAFGPESIYLSPAPLYHAAPLGMTSAIQSLGGTVVLMPGFEPEGFLAAIERWKVTDVQVVPTMFARLLELPDEVRARFDLSSLRHVIHAAAPCPVHVKRQMLDWLGPVIWEYYAGSEGIGQCEIGPEEWLEHPGSVGRPIIGELHICDDEGRELPAGEVGTIYFGGARELVYHNDDEKTQAARNPLHREWATMGDAGYVDEDGYLYLADRRDFMIISGGVNIYPQEVEDLLLTHPAVRDVAVFGVPNATFGEEVKAVVEPVEPIDDEAAMQEQLIEWCRTRLSHIKCPRSVDFSRKIPRSETGKLLKKQLRAAYWAASSS